MIADAAVGQRAVAPQIAKPLAARVLKVFVRPFVHLSMPLRVFGVAGHGEGEQCGDDRLVVRPPKLHFRPILLHRFVVHINKIH